MGCALLRPYPFEEVLGRRLLVKKKGFILSFLINMDLYISMIGLVVLTLITCAGTAMRYIFNAPFVWQEEVQMILVVWIVFWGASAAFRTGNHIAIEILVDALPEKAQRIIRAIIDMITAGALIFVICVEWGRVTQLALSGRTTSILKIPQAYNYSGVLLACVFMLVNFIAAEIRFFKRCAGGESV